MALTPQLSDQLEKAFGGLVAAGKQATAAFDRFAAAIVPFGAAAALELELREWRKLAMLQQHLPEMKPEPTATTWVYKTKEGELKPIDVVDMPDDHLWRWVRYFRRKYRQEGFSGSNAVLDSIIQSDMVTGPAIYAEAVKRGLSIGYVALEPASAPQVTTTTTEEHFEDGYRRITLEDED